jgi:integrase
LSEVTVSQIKNAKPALKPYKLSDGGGLYVLISIAGSKTFKCKYSFHGKSREDTLGRFPEFSLAQARHERERIKRALREKIDPRGKVGNAITLDTLLDEWLGLQDWKEDTRQDREARLDRYIRPVIGHIQIDELDALTILEVLREVESKTATVARRLLGMLNRALDLAVVEERLSHNPAARLGTALNTVPRTKHHPARTEPAEVGALLRAIDALKGSYVTIAALRLAALTLLRSSEIRLAVWDEFSGDTWVVPAERMKGGAAAHTVPLSRESASHHFRSESQKWRCSIRVSWTALKALVRERAKYRACG